MEGQKEVDEVIGKNSPDEKNDQVKSDIYTMPDEFYVPVKTKSKKWLYIIIIIVGLIAVFGGATAYVLLTRETPVAEETPVIPDTSEIEDANTITPVVEEPTVINQTETDLTDTNNIDMPLADAQAVVELPVLLPLSVDLDGDGLTDIEEIFLGIDPAVADTDGDGFFDGAEVFAGYDPSQENVNLSSNPIFKEYANETPSFSLLVPRDWTEKRTLSKEDSIEFIAPNKDIFLITIEANSGADPIDTWFSNKYLNRTTNELTNRTVGGRVAKESIMRREVYIPISSFVLVIHYDVAGKKEVAYPGVFEFMLNSITFLGG